ncbi:MULTISPECIES: NAD(P)H-dependent oxidoreductase [Brevibacillus]|jgi:NAD(P)H dehydrogenase (quinone)|uniref:NAD(P)H dehydrogenase n=1 Tax=Brevibacillus aydinogluensis TaxID=927786 RepID=A0AA48RI24_9BACL|nr:MULTISPECIES: NAD(P)H-dependent oxidoreductase [Bacillales]MDT3416541.1 NAD(P)H dehydrogenase (quinone) [Brevibacillus aydinogluensis]UFJ60171.1 NAD(P)H-dependent oxidoreductase [Anoxybacillus sediminis]CAJ1003182.1 NAD(P)H dehydrogenase [Brevibacillus aydinogluensis]
MKACIVFAHEGTKSFAHQILQRVVTACEAAGIRPVVRDLYQIGFDPVFDAEDMHLASQGRARADVEEEQQLITDADLLVMIYPVWWWSPPAILKGYLDRVFTDGFAFRYGDDGPVGMLNGKQALVFTTTRESEQEMRADGFDEVVRKQIVDGTLKLIGYDVTYRNFAAVPYVSEAERAAMLEEAEALVRRIRQPVGV